GVVPSTEVGISTLYQPGSRSRSETTTGGSCWLPVGGTRRGSSGGRSGLNGSTCTASWSSWPSIFRVTKLFLQILKRMCPGPPHAVPSTGFLVGSTVTSLGSPTPPLHNALGSTAVSCTPPWGKSPPVALPPVEYRTPLSPTTICPAAVVCPAMKGWSGTL